MRRAEPLPLEPMPMRGTDQEERLLREGKSAQQYGTPVGLAAMCLREME